MRSSIHENVRSLAMHKTPAPCQAIIIIASVCARHTIQSAAVSEELKHPRKPAHKLAVGLLISVFAICQTMFAICQTFAGSCQSSKYAPR